MAGETEDDIPESGAVFTFGKSKFADNIPSKFWMKNDKPLRIYCGDEHTALITDNGKLFMFGNNNCGQLGFGTKTTVNKPTCVKALKCEKVKLAACGRNHTLLATTRGNVYAAGGNDEGQLGLGDCIGRASFHRLHFFSGQAPIKMLAAGSNTSAALTEDGMLFMWGDNSEGQIGLGNESHAPNPREVSVGRPVTWVSCGYYHSAFVTVDGDLFTFGECNGGKLGLPPEQCSNHRVPQPVLGIPNRVTQVACGGAHTVALTAEGVYTFGLGQYGQLGLGTFIFQAHLPKGLDYFHNGRANHVACGENHTAVITDSGLLYTFGDGRHGKLGLGVENFTNQFKPTVNPRFLKHRVLSVTCGGCHMLVLARPRSKDSGPLRLEEGDVTEDYLEKSFKELLEGGSTFPILHRSLTARVRRRERERSPEQFGLMVSTLPTVTASFLNTSMAISSCTLPPRLPSHDLPHQGLQNGIQYIRHPSSPKMDTMTLEGTADAEDVKDDGSVKDLGDTADLLNNRTHRAMDLSDKVLSVSPVHKAKKAKAVKRQGKTVKGEEPNWAPPKGGADSVRRQALPTELLRGSGLSKAPQHVDTSPREKRPASPRADGSQLLTQGDRQPAEVKSKLKAGRGKPVPCKNQPTEQDNPSEVQNVTTMARGQAMSQSDALEVSRKSEKVQIKHPEIKSTPIEETRYKPTEKKGRQRKAKVLVTEVKERPVAGGKGHMAVGGEPRVAVGGEPRVAVGGEPRVKVKSMPMKGKGKAKAMEVTHTREKTFATDSRDFLKNQEAAVCTERPLGLSTAPKPKSTPEKVKAVTVVRSQSPGQKRISDNKTTTHGLKEPIVVSEVARTEPTSHQWNMNVLTDVYSHLPEVGMESPARVLTETVTRGAEPEPGSEDAASTPRGLSRTERSTKQRAIADPSWSESLESVSGSGKRTSIVINVLPEAGGSEPEVETISADQGQSGTDTLEDVRSGNQTESGEDNDSPVSDDRRKDKSLEKEEEEEDDGGRPGEANVKSRNRGLMYENMDSSGGEPECEEAVEGKAEDDEDSKDEDEVNSKTRSSEEESEEDDTASRAKKSTSDQEENEEDTEKEEGEKSNVDDELESETEATVNGEGSGQEKDTEEESEQEEEEEEESLDKDQSEGEESIASVTEEEASGDESESKGEESEVVSEEEDEKGEEDESTVEVEGEETEDESGIEEEEEDEDDENDVEAEEGEEEESTEEEEEGDQNEESSVEEEDEKEGEEGDQEEGSSVEEEEGEDQEEGSSVEEEEEADEEEEPDEEEEGGDQEEGSSVEEEEGEDQEEGSSVEEEEGEDEEEEEGGDQEEGSSVEEEEGEDEEEEEPDEEEESGIENEEGKEEDEEEENEGEDEEDEDEEEGKGETDEESDNEEEGEGEGEDEGKEEEGENEGEEDEEEFEGDKEEGEDEEVEEENKNEGEGGEGDEGEEEEENEEEEEKSVEERKQDGQKQKSKPLGKKSETKLAQSGIAGKRSAKKPEISGSQDPQQFWNDVLPQYLNLK